MSSEERVTPEMNVSDAAKTMEKFVDGSAAPAPSHTPAEIPHSDNFFHLWNAEQWQACENQIGAERTLALRKIADQQAAAHQAIIDRRTEALKAAKWTEADTDRVTRYAKQRGVSDQELAFMGLFSSDRDFLIARDAANAFYGSDAPAPADKAPAPEPTRSRDSGGEMARDEAGRFTKQPRTRDKSYARRRPGSLEKGADFFMDYLSREDR